MTAAEYADVDRRLRPGAVAQPVQLPVRRDGRHRRGDGAGQAVRRDPGRARAGPDDGLVDGRAGPDGPTGGGRRLRRGSAGPGHRELRHRLRGAAGRRAAAAAPLARRRRLRDRGRDRPAARRPRPGRHRVRAGHRTPALGRDRPGDVHPRYADRIGGIHIKDCFPDHLDVDDLPSQLPRARGDASGCGPSRASGWSTSTRCWPRSRPTTTATS